MDPLALLRDILIVAQAIQKHINLIKKNQKELQNLASLIQQVIASLPGLDALPRHQHYIDSLTAFHTCLSEAEKFISTLSKMGKLTQWGYAQTNERHISEFKARIFELLPLLTVGLTAQNLMDREQDREEDRVNDVADQQFYLQQQEHILRAIQSAQLNPSELEDIIQKQLASFEQKVENLLRPSTLDERAFLPAECIVNLVDLVFGHRLAEGSCGLIYLGHWREQPVTIKWVNHIDTEQHRQQFRREVQVISRLHNEYIAPFYGACLESSRMCLVMGVMEKGELSDLLTSLTLVERLQMAQDLALGLTYLHDQGIVHGDIKPKSIWVNRFNQAKWTDFGLVKTRSNSIASLPVVSQEACWQAPESWQRRSELSQTSDIYSFGMVLWTLIVGRLPYLNLPKADIMAQVKNGLRETFPSTLPTGYVSLIQACWSPDSSQRPRAIDIARALQRLSNLAPQLPFSSAIKAPVAVLPRVPTNKANTIKAPLPMPPRPASPTGEALYQSGVNAQKKGDDAAAYQFYKQSSQKNYSKSYTNLGIFALEGLGGQPINLKKARGFLEQSATAGHVRAMFNLGRIYEKGEVETGVPDNVQALAWYRKALTADPGNLRYQEKVAKLTALVTLAESNYERYSH